MVGIDIPKIGKIMSTIDFKFLRENINECKIWDAKRLLKRIKLKKNENENSNIHLLSFPVFNSDKNIAFIIHTQKCQDGINCHPTLVKVFKKTKSEWLYYTSIPISLN